MSLQVLVNFKFSRQLMELQCCCLISSMLG